MNAKTFTLVLLTAAVAAGAGWFAATRAHRPAATAAANGERKIKFYQSPMHPWIKSDKPGKCTICGMDLVPVYEGDKGFSEDGNLVTLAPASAAVIGVQTSEARRAPLARTLRVTGVLDDDETQHRYVSAYVEGRIEKLFVNTIGEEVVAGQPLAVLYSPEFLVARQEFHALARRDSRSPLLAAAREKLRRLGLLDTQIDALATADEVTTNTEILAPKTGTVVARDEMTYEGGYVMPGTRLFTIGDFSRMWFIFDAYEPDLAWLRVGQTVDVTTPSRPGEVFSAPIAFIDPNLNEMTRTARVRVVLDNAARRLLHRQTAYGHVKLDAAEALVIPRSAVVRTQAQPLVYVAKGGEAYEPRPVQLGRSGDAEIEILAGLRAGEKIVTQGALLLDGQAQLAHSAGGGHQHGAAAPASPSASDAAEPTASPGTAAVVVLPRDYVLAIADAAEALAVDDLAAYAKLVPALKDGVHQTGAAHDTLMPLAQKLVAGPDLDAARAAFEPFATAVADVVRTQPAAERGVKIFQCPMSPVLGTGRWVQRGDNLRNPFFGSAMLECGEEIK
ncbi:MAG TPA: efflux RND transporter periplasmic adaptor subunit [Opitutaceae bacterium]